MITIEIKELTIGINSPSFLNLFISSQTILDKRGHPRAFEITLLPGMVGEIIDEPLDGDTFLIRFPFYPSPVYVLKNHVSFTKGLYEANFLNLDEQLNRLKSCLGRAYLWGGNHLGKTQFFKKHFNLEKKTIREERAIELDGIDCSGLLFYATNFKTPRNTKDLQTYGESVKDIAYIRPLDLILTKGHVMIVLDNSRVIQSKQNRGVFVSSLRVELFKLFRKKIFKEKVMDESEFSIRRYY